jgi:hypothetical protein
MSQLQSHGLTSSIFVIYYRDSSHGSVNSHGGDSNTPNIGCTADRDENVVAQLVGGEEDNWCLGAGAEEGVIL